MQCKDGGLALSGSPQSALPGEPAGCACGPPACTTGTSFPPRGPCTAFRATAVLRGPASGRKQQMLLLPTRCGCRFRWRQWPWCDCRAACVGGDGSATDRLPAVVVLLHDVRDVSVEEEKVRYFGKGYMVVLRLATGFSHPLTQSAVMGHRR